MITFDEFKNNRVDEGLFDKLTGMFSKVTSLFKDPQKMQSSVDTTMDQLGDKTKKFAPKQAKVNESYIVQMGDPTKPETKFTMALTKLADLPDGSGLFQITGTTSKEMMKALVNSENVEDLTKNSVMAMISANGFEKGKTATMKLLNNVIPGGKDYITKTMVTGVVPSTAVQVNAAKTKTA